MATTVKLIRALWIIPLSLVIAIQQKKDGGRSVKFPWFILFFLFAILFAHFFPELHASYDHFSWLGRRGMVVALFLIGSDITPGEIKQSGPRSFALGITLWVLTAVGSLFFLIR